MAAEINHDALSCARAWYPTACISGSGGPWGVARLNYGTRAAIVFFPTKAEASEIAAKTGDRLIEFKTPVPKIRKHQELGYE